MADIDVVKKGSHVWLWIILAIVVALILWYVLAGSGARSQQTGVTFEHHAPLAQIAAAYLPAA